ncbi:MAG: Mut7-C RNAse domain-containing protein [Candidatus Hecatellaceae archaeon]
MRKHGQRFLVDGMLGSLARWLRLLGYDVEYRAELDDSSLIREAKASGRILLTRDLDLYRNASRRAVEAFLVEASNLEEALEKVSERFGLKLQLQPSTTRCPVCNSPLRQVSRKEVEGRVPEGVYRRKRRFWVCVNPSCGKVYWRGSHWDKIKETLRRVSNRRGRKVG